MIFFSNRDLGLTNSKLNTALRSKGTAWALGFGSFSGALLRDEKNIKIKKDLKQ
ncbi:hypothetical protein MU007_001644 [Campylobacter upsaliensis]|nr:hypothetical protein [Campylobacter upsaliensis]